MYEIVALVLVGIAYTVLHIVTGRAIANRLGHDEEMDDEESLRNGDRDSLEVGRGEEHST